MKWHYVAAALSVCPFHNMLPECFAQEVAKPRTVVTRASRESEARASTSDPAFETYLNVPLLTHAWHSQDSALLTDIALQVAEGERVLFRKHKLFKSGALLELAAYVAADTDDKATLERLAGVAAAKSDAKLTELVKSAPDKLATPAADKHELAPAVDAASRHSAAIHKATLRHILAIRICGDKASLEKLRQEIDALKDLGEKQKLHLFEVIKEHAVHVESGNPELRSTITVLEQLASVQ